MSIDNGKLLCSATSGKLLCHPTTGKLLYGIEDDPIQPYVTCMVITQSSFPEIPAFAVGQQWERDITGAFKNPLMYNYSIKNWGKETWVLVDFTCIQSTAYYFYNPVVSAYPILARRSTSGSMGVYYEHKPRYIYQPPQSCVWTTKTVTFAECPIT